MDLFRHSGNDYRVATLFRSYLTTTGITNPSLKTIGQFQHVSINELSCTDGPTLQGSKSDNPIITDRRTDRRRADGQKEE